MTHKQLKLSGSARLIVAETKVIVYSELGTFVIDDAEVVRLVERVRPLLDGSKKEDDIVNAFQTHERANVRVLLKLLERRCAIEAADDTENRLQRFFRIWSDEPDELIRRVRQARVLIVGGETPGVIAASQLAEAGIAELHIAEDDRVIREDPHWDLLIVAMSPEDIGAQLEWAHLAHQAKIKSIFASCTGLEAIVGPFVVPGETACWNCSRLRMLANAEDAFAAHKLQHQFITMRSSRSVSAMPPAMASLCGHLLSLEALKILSGYAPSQLLNHVLIQNLVTLQTSVHPVVPMPWCEICGGAAAIQRNPSPTDVRGWIDSRTGVISEVTIRQLDSAKLDSLFCAQALPARYTEGAYSGDAFESCGGKGLTEDAAITGAIGESIERYSASRIRLQDLRRSPLEGEDFLDPRQLCLYDESQYSQKGFPFRRFDPERLHYWVKGQWLDNKQSVWAPALMTYYNFPAGADDPVCQVTTNGLAAGNGLEDATLRAVFELIERDAFMMSWLCRRPGKRLILDETLDASTRNVIAQLESYGANIELYLLDGDVDIPVVACLGLGDGATWPGLTVTSAAHLSPHIAVRNAVLEHAYSGLSLRQRMFAAKQSTPLTPAQVRPGSFLDHALFYLPRERATNCHFLRSDPAHVSLRDLHEPTELSLDACSQHLTSAGLRIAVIDVTSPDVALTSFRVVRALGVNMQPIYCGHGMQRLANPRLLSQSQGHPNADPHPLC